MSILNFNLYSKKSQTKEGFLLLEIAITISIIMLMNLYICNWYSRVVLEHTIFKEKIEALNIACNFIENYRAFNFIDKDKKIKFDVKRDKSLPNFLWINVFVNNISIKTGIIYEK